MSEETNRSTSDGSRPGWDPIGWTIGLLVNVKFAVIVLVLLAIACIVGTFIPQEPAVAAFLREHPDSAGRIALLGKLGLTDIYSSSCSWFVTLLVLLSASLLACTYRRLRVAMHVTGRRRLRAIGSVFTHISMVIVLVGALMRLFLGEDGGVWLREGQTITHFHGSRGETELPFALHLVKFETEMYELTSAPGRPEVPPGRLLAYWPATKTMADFDLEMDRERVMTVDSEDDSAVFTFVVLRYVPDFVVDTTTKAISSRGEKPRNPAILVRIEGGGNMVERWLFSKHPDYKMHSAGEQVDQDLLPLAQYQKSESVKDWRSHLQVIENGEVVVEKAVEVNSPLSRKGYTFFQSGYDPGDATRTQLQVVKDPGVPVVYLGFTLMIVGPTMLFGVNPTGGVARPTQDREN